MTTASDVPSFGLCAAMGDDNFACICSLIDDALIASRSINVFKTLIWHAADIYISTILALFIWLFINIACQLSILLCGESHGESFLAIRVTLNNCLRNSSLN